MVRRSGAPWWSFATRTSVRCPTTSRPSRTQPLRRSSRRRPAPSSSAARSGAGVSAGSRTRRSAPARRANATSRASWSARLGGRGPRRAGTTGVAGVVAGPVPAAPARAVPRSSTRMSTARAWSSVPAIASASAGSSGTRTASHSRRTPRATASTGSSARGRSTQAASAPPTCASASTRSASVVAPLDPAPASATVPARGRPPAARSASSAGKPVGIVRSVAAGAGRERGATGTAFGVPMSGSGSSAGRPPGGGVVGSGAVAGSGHVGGFAVGREATASAPNTSVAGRGAAAPQRSRREARTAVRSGLRSIGQPTIEHLFDVGKGHVACHAIPARPPALTGLAAGSGGRATLSPGDRPPARAIGLAWGCSSAGRAPRSHRGGQGFESPHLHHPHDIGHRSR